MIVKRLVSLAEQAPDRIAIRFGGLTISRSELVAQVAGVAGWLKTQGLRRGDRVAWLGANDPFMIELLVAVAATGTIFVPLNSRLTVAEHRTQIEHCGARLAIAGPDYTEHLRSATKGRCPATLRPDLTSTDTHHLNGTHHLNDTHHLSDAPGADEPEPGDPLLLVYTSGTTGSPKGAVHTHGALAVTIANGIESQDLSADDVTLSFLPLFHVGGLNIQTLPTLMVGGTLVLHAGFDPATVLSDIERHRVTTAVFVPATMRAVIDHPTWLTADLSSVRGVMTGSSVVPPALLCTFNERGLRAGQVYGSTETGPTCVVLGFDQADRVGAAGRAAPHSQTRIVDGELQVRGDHLFTHYWNAPELTAAAFDGEWYRTGDLARQDQDGFIYVDGRVDEAIISGGENIDPVEVEEALLGAPGVADVAVVASPDDHWGQVPVAFVVTEPGTTPLLDELRSHAEATLARFKLPTALHIVDELPRTALGKVQKFALRQRL